WGYTEIAPKMLSLFSMFLTTICIFLIVRKSSISSFCTILLIWPFLSVTIHNQANEANIEVFLLPFLFFYWYLLSAYKETGKAQLWYAAVGILSLSFLLKQVTLPFALLAFTFMPLKDLKNAKLMLIRCLGFAGTVLAIHLIVYASTVGLEALFNQFTQVMGHGSKAKSLGSGEQVSLPIRFLKTLFMFPFHDGLIRIFPVTALALTATVLTALKEKWKSLPLIACWLMAIIAVILPGSDSHHYYIIFIFPLLLSFCALVNLGQYKIIFLIVTGVSLLFQTAFFFHKNDIVSGNRWYVICLIVLAVVALILPLIIMKKKIDCSCHGLITPFLCLVFLGLHTSYYYLSKNKIQISWQKYGDWFYGNRYVGEQLKIMGIHDKKIYVNGSNAGIYFYSNNLPAIPYHASYTLGLGYVTEEKFLDLLNQNKPEYIILPAPTTNVKGFVQWTDAHYDLYNIVPGTRNKNVEGIKILRLKTK
ncbi:MAG: hypothetical protein HRT89_08855, partial [Lentisphaeria bacterium]|nr:hypothetical protein [Lentisphaeria bacterium]NQZ68167.1 hypothetical protein [Lentisphaeria bacterium]